MICKSLKEVDRATIKTRKKIKIFTGTNEKSYYCTLFFIEQKSRILQKHILEYDVLVDRLKEINNHNFRHKYLKIDAPLCSKAKELAKKSGWKILRGYHDTV